MMMYSRQIIAKQTDLQYSSEYKSISINDMVYMYQVLEEKVTQVCYCYIDKIIVG